MHALPIEEIRPEFEKKLSQGPVVVEAPPGSGKSTKLPLWCGETGRTLVVEPRRLPCRSLAEFVARCEGTEAGGRIGYAIRFQSRYSENSRIVFATPGVALRWFAADGFAGFDTVILDEFHERRWDTDLLAALLRETDKRLVLTSATVEGGRLARYLGGSRIRAEGKLFDVTVQYAEQNSLPRTKDLDKRAADAAAKALERSEGGDVLVFLPGKGEIQGVQSRLAKKGVRAETIPLHASVDRASQDKALNPEGSPRIILATNVAETSLTLPGVRVVVDSGLERRTHYRNGRTVLALAAISQAAADQRSGRAGRLGPGLCLRLWGRAARLEPYTPPEVVREDPAEFVLAAAACGRRIRDMACPDSIPEHSLEAAVNRLRGMGAIDVNGDITEHGRALFRLPLDSQLAHLIAAASGERTQSDIVDLAAALTAQGPILSPNQSDKGREELAHFAPEPCDACTLIRLVRAVPPKAIQVNGSALTEARRTAEQIRQGLGIAQASEDAPDREELVRQILRADPELAFVRRIKRDYSLGNGSEEVEVGSGTRMQPSHAAAVVLDRHSVPGKGTTRTITIATCLAPVTFAELARAGMGEIVRRDPYWRDERIQQPVERVYAGRVIDSWVEEPEGNALCTAVAELMAKGELWPETGERLRRDIEAWNLYIRLGFDSGEQVDLRAWLAERLAEIGLETCEDLEVLEPEDLRFNGVPEWERDQFDRFYPRHLSLANLEVDVEYEPALSRITLVKTSGIRKDPPQRWELPAWGRGWEVRFRAGSKVVPIS
jgi:ATP-dependent helicase HrpB